MRMPRVRTANMSSQYDPALAQIAHGKMSVLKYNFENYRSCYVSKVNLLVEKNSNFYELIEARYILLITIQSIGIISLD